mmetsp:Transcript_30260/g.47407  ORF Transcript_30260/g.47407 Transcript_30260/m.47407 type:complete len:124 (+) Transcript_30260:218-589(+)|eukprot:CAMPEP_0184325944 /NCGR_PEP_ID=MMETSP1049-20130417/142303_1 /TAXON_ID=77928 /ORGANISM="Proteomonas sulcata, Strain CCMP704" /LENGTH=123 /DNA_ID=CAMNT_0026648111 /DNA_START=219 /DNA_END=590 /DNA_ORIENTATION=+
MARQPAERWLGQPEPSCCRGKWEPCFMKDVHIRAAVPSSSELAQASSAGSQWELYLRKMAAPEAAVAAGLSPREHEGLSRKSGLQSWRETVASSFAEMNQKADGTMHPAVQQQGKLGVIGQVP